MAESNAEAPSLSLQHWLLREHAQDDDRLELADAMEDIARAARQIAHAVRQGGLSDALGSAGTDNVQGETQQKLDLLSNEIMIDALRWSGHWVGLASEEMETALPITECRSRTPYLCVFDPLDGSSNIAVNAGVGTIFSVLRAPAGSTGADAQDYCQPGSAQRAAGFVLYGPSTTLVISAGKGVGVFTLDAGSGEFRLTQDQLRIPRVAREFSVNMTNRRYWAKPVQRYIDECMQGTDGARTEHFSMRYAGSMVADVYRLLIKGGVFLYPWDSKDANKPGKLRLLYEANPMSFIVEHAGGLSSTGHERVMDLIPEQLHQRCPIVVGSADEIERIIQYSHEEEAGD